MSEEFIEWSKAHHSLTEFVVGFCRFLRLNEFSISVDSMRESLQIISFTKGYTSMDALGEVLKIVLCKNAIQVYSFDDLFKQYWKERERAANSKEKRKKNPASGADQPNKQHSLDALKSWLYNEHVEEEKHTSLYSTHQSFERKTFVDFSEAELEEVLNAIKRMGRTWAFHLSRRRKKDRRGQLDISQLIRKNLSNGNELIHLAFEQRKKSKLKLVILCDVSRSMELYSRFFIQFAMSFQTAFKKVRTFLFGTELVQFQPNLFLTQDDWTNQQIPQFGSGTNIGESLRQFTDDHLKRVVDKNTILLIMSDGWDTADSGLVGVHMKKIDKACKKIIWLNPLMSSPEFRPETIALQEALPYIDKMLPVHNLNSLKELLREI